MKKVVIYLIGILLLIWVGLLIGKYILFPAAVSLNLVERAESTEEKWENIKSKLHLQPIYKGESKLLQNLCSWADQKEAASIAYLGVSKDGRPHFQISRPHWVGENKYWVEQVVILLEVGEEIQLACGYEIRLFSFDPGEAKFSVERWKRPKK